MSEMEGRWDPAVKASQMLCFLCSRGWKELSLFWEFLLPKSHLLVLSIVIMP